AAVAVRVGFGRVVVVPRFGFPRADDLRVERPVRNVNPLDRIDERSHLQRARGQPLALVPAVDLIADVVLSDLERQQALRTDRCLDFLVIDELWRAAELAALPDAVGIEHRDGLAALTLYRPLLGLPPALFVGNLAQRLDEIEFLDFARRRDLVRRFRPAERAHEFLLARIPLGLRAAGRTRMLVERADATC